MTKTSANNITPFRRPGLHVRFGTYALPAILLFAALAVSNRAAAGQFAATYFTPNSQTVNVGTQTSVDLNFGVGSYVAYGIDAWIAFNPTMLQVVSVTTGNSSPFSSVSFNTFDNSLGTLRYAATGGTVSNSTLTAATIVFSAIGPGTSPIDITNVNELILNYGPFGVNGLAVDGSITVEGSAAVSTPDASSTIVLVGGVFLSLVAMRRRFVRA